MTRILASWQTGVNSHAFHLDGGQEGDTRRRNEGSFWDTNGIYVQTHHSRRNPLLPGKYLSCLCVNDSVRSNLEVLYQRCHRRDDFFCPPTCVPTAPGDRNRLFGNRQWITNRMYYRGTSLSFLQLVKDCSAKSETIRIFLLTTKCEEQVFSCL